MAPNLPQGDQPSEAIDAGFGPQHRAKQLPKRCLRQTWTAEADSHLGENPLVIRPKFRVAVYQKTTAKEPIVLRQLPVETCLELLTAETLSAISEEQTQHASVVSANVGGNGSNGSIPRPGKRQNLMNKA